RLARPGGGLEIISNNCYPLYQIPAAVYNCCCRAAGLWSAREGSGERGVLNTTIMLFLLQDGITNGAIYALLGLALVLVFAVTRVILIPQGEFITYGALSYAMLATGQVPGTARLAMAMGVVAFALDLFAARKSLRLRFLARAAAINILFPAVILALTYSLAGPKTPIAVNIALALLIVAA